MKIDVEKIKTAYEAASAEQKEQIEKMFPGAFECAKSEDSEETLETLVDKLKAWLNQNKDKRVVALFAADKDRPKGRWQYRNLYNRQPADAVKFGYECWYAKRY